MRETVGLERVLLSAIDRQGPLEVALILKRTGTPLASWIRDGVPAQVLSVMSSTLVGCIDVIAENLGIHSPLCVSVDFGSHELLARSINDQAVLVLIARRGAVRGSLIEVSREILRVLPLPGCERIGRSATLGNGM